MAVGSECCFHDTCRVSIFHGTPETEKEEATTQTIAEVWPAEDDIDIADGRFIVRACNAHDDLVAMLGAVKRCSESHYSMHALWYEFGTRIDAALAKAKGE